MYSVTKDVMANAEVTQKDDKFEVTPTFSKIMCDYRKYDI